MRTNIKGFIAKVLVLCMVFTMLPTMALAVEPGGDDQTYYTVKADTISNGTVSIYYEISDDAYANNQLDTNKTYSVAYDTTVKVTLTPNSGYYFNNSSSYYTIEGDTTQHKFSSGDGSVDAAVTKDIVITNNLTIHAVFSPQQSVSPGSGGGGGGGGSSATVNTSSAKNGSFTVSDKNAKAGDTVTVTPTPDKGFVVDNVVVKDKNGGSVTVTKNADGTFSFKMPEAKLQPVTVEVNFREETVTDIYTDVPADSWYANAVKYCYDNGLMDGIGGDEFAPNAVTTRAMVVTVLYRIEGEPSASGNGGFTDVPSGQWYTEAVAWAKAHGIVNGYSATEFAPDDAMTREQMAAVMFRYAEYKGVASDTSADLSGYTDAGKVSTWAEEAMEWANAEKIITGTSTTKLAPSGSSTRAQLATVLMRYFENVVK